MLTIEDAVFEFRNCEDKKMRYCLLGNTGLKVSEMALGTWGIGGLDGIATQMKAEWMRFGLRLSKGLISLIRLLPIMRVQQSGISSR